jgi:hypothetical protein
VHAGAFKARRGYDCRPLEQAGPRHVDEQALEANEFMAIDVVQSEILDLEGERERIGADGSDTQIAAEIVRYHIDRKAGCHPG